MLMNDCFWVGIGNGVILFVFFVVVCFVRDDGEMIINFFVKGGMGGFGGVVCVYSNEGKDGEVIRGFSFMFYCFMVSGM